MPPKRRQYQHSTYNQINLTNMIDMLFFLLVVFMLEINLLNNSGDVTLPKMNAEPIISEGDSKIINVKSDGSIVFDRRVISETELQTMLSNIKQEGGSNSAIYLRGDENACYGVVMDVMSLIRRVGFRSVNLVTQAEDIP